MDLREIGLKAKNASREIGTLSTRKKNEVLTACADALMDSAAYILEENKKDVSDARSKDMAEHMLDRLLLTEFRIEEMAKGLKEMALLPDPVGEVISMTKRPNGLLIGKKRVPIGVVGIIYEARPNVTSDAFGLCFKTGNAVILKGGSDAINSNIAIVSIMRRAINSCGVTEDALQLIEDTSHET
ncbi:MAG: aldehyde dehydrogenase family protein, partial [Firmicutes bacterium]|nr:aldehyde dehydrogenase family protein [Bacillota bacterium]